MRRRCAWSRARPRSTASWRSSRSRFPTLIVASHDDLDPEHPYEVAQIYAERIEGAELISEEPGASPLAWRGAQLSRAIMSWLARAAVIA